MKSTAALGAVLALTLPGVPAVEAATARPSVALHASSRVANYGWAVTLSGTVGSHAAGRPVSILAQRVGAPGFTTVGIATTTAGGAYSFPVKPMVQTAFRASSRDGTSGQVRIDVRPAVVLAVARARTATFIVETVTERALAGRYVDVQRQNRVGRWVTLERVRLSATATPMIAAAKFTLRIPRGTSTLRAALPQAQAGTNYLGATSVARSFTR
jgi:hypothetical protein